MKRNLIIGQSGGPTSVINATLAGIIRAAKTLPEFGSIYGLAHGLEGALAGSWIDLSGLSDAQLDVLARTPGAALGSSRKKLTDSEYAQVIENFRAHDVGYFAYLGGNGSMWEAARGSGGLLTTACPPKSVPLVGERPAGRSCRP